MTGTPDSDSSRRDRTTVNALYASRPLRGSSKKSILGLQTSSTPIETRFCSPPERPFRTFEPIGVSAQPSRCKQVSIPWT
mmetsp:Transcript_10024/g.22101  ORF Transcript_10024/g.22101 Transcript_10024/m.22101 type:complete len:80 (-) Transcript_10024:1051-1290(-)